MSDILVGEGSTIRSVSDGDFLRALEEAPRRMAKRLEFMTPEHHAVRDFVVRELPRERRPLSPRQIATVTGLALDRVTAILAELERNLFFLVRDSRGGVSWAFPVTTERTAHHLAFSTGETVFGA